MADRWRPTTEATSRAPSRSAIVEKPRMSLNSTVTSTSCGSIAVSGCAASRSASCWGTNDASVLRDAVCSTTAACMRLNSSTRPAPPRRPPCRGTARSPGGRRPPAWCRAPPRSPRSRGPSPSCRAARGRARPRRCGPESRSAIDGSTVLPPACTSRIARASSSPCAIRSFSRYARPLWPLPSSASAYSSSSCARQDHDARVRVLLADRVRAVDPLELERRRHLDVGDDHVGHVLGGGGEQRGRVLGHPHDLDVVVGLQQRPHALAHEHVVLAEHDRDAHAARLPSAGGARVPSAHAASRVRGR